MLPLTFLLDTDPLSPTWAELLVVGGFVTLASFVFSFLYPAGLEE
jgi:hypothetical protein